MLTQSKKNFIKKLLHKKYREKEGVFLVEGWRAVEEIVHSHYPIEILLSHNNVEEKYRTILSSAQKKTLECFQLTEKEISSISETEHSQGIIAVVKKLHYDFSHELTRLSQQTSALVVALDTIADPGNLGTIIRTCDWFGVDMLLLSKQCVELYNPKVVRSTVGSLFHLPIITDIEIENVISDFRSFGFTAYGTEIQSSSEIQKTQWSKKSLIVIGSEARGISSSISSLLDEKISIPKFGKAESLNASVACGVVLAQYKLENGKNI